MDLQKLLEEPIPWIGMYVAAASLACTLAMTADVLHGFWSKKYWFPSKYFSLNATSLTLLAVVMKLPVDLTAQMCAVTDRLAKISSILFISTAMANFLPSLGSMNNKEVVMNVTALGILVITVTANVCIQVIQLHSFLKLRHAFPEELLAISFMLLLLVMFISSALMIPSTKRYLVKKHHEMQKHEEVDNQRVTTDKLRVLIKKCWMMAETSCPQFVVARSVTCTVSSILSLLIALILVEAEIRMAMEHRWVNQLDSNYGWSTKWILITQTIGVVVGNIAPASRWFIAIKFRSSNEGSNSSFTVEGYWTQKMSEWRQGSLPVHIQHLKGRKVLHDLRGLFLKWCISVQYLTVLASKLVLFISVSATKPIISCLNHVGKIRQKRIRDLDSSHDSEMESRHYVMLLEGEVELPTEILGNICKEMNEVIKKGKLQKPKKLLELLHKSCNFRGVIEFDSCGQDPSLHSQEIPYCWLLPVVTLTSIAIALPKVEKKKSSCLLNSVSEGLLFVKLIDKSLDTKGGLANVRTAADVAWVEVEVYHMWQDKDLQEASLKGKNAEEILQHLCDKAENTVMDFKKDARDCLMRNPLNWPSKVIAANSMYRISRTILLSRGDESDETDEELFERLSIMIADILAACFTNLAHVITIKCHSTAIEEREGIVRQAALLLGESEEILELLQQREVPILAPDQPASLQEWRALLKLESKSNQDLVSKSNTKTDASKFRGEHVTVKVEK